MSDLMWKSDEQLLELMRAGRLTKLKLEKEIEELENSIGCKRSAINNLGTQMEWANKYLMHDLSGTRWENDMEGWLAQRSTNRPATAHLKHKRNLDLCTKHKQEWKQSHFDTSNCDYCKLEEIAYG
jgi:hypothetical protein